MLDCFLHCIQMEKHTKPIALEMHVHPYDEFVYYDSGQGTTQIKHTVYPYQGGCFSYIRAGTPHNEINHLPCRTVWIHCTNRIPGLSLQEGLFPDPHMKLLASIEHLRGATLEQVPHQDVLTESCLAQFLAVAAQLQQTQNCLTEKINWQKVLSYLDENSIGSVDFSALAARYHYSYDRFRHLFRERFGVSPQQYVISQRIARAKYLLLNTSFSLTDIAYHCGFNSSSQFCNLFRKHIGMTPGAFRKSDKIF